MQILHLKTRIKRENSILPRHLTAVKVGVIYCSGGVTAVYCTTPVHSTPSCGRAEGVAQYTVCHLRLVKLMFLSCGHLTIMCHHNPTYLQPPAECSLVTTWALAWLGTRRAGEVTAQTSWRSLVEAGVGSRQPGDRAVVRPGHLPHTRGHHTTATSTQQHSYNYPVAVWL